VQSWQGNRFLRGFRIARLCSGKLFKGACQWQRSVIGFRWRNTGGDQIHAKATILVLPVDGGEEEEMAFDLETWKEELREPIRRFSADPKGALQRAGATTLFGYLAGVTLFPLAAAAAKGEVTAVLLTLGGIAGGVGANLVAHKMQSWKDEAAGAHEIEDDLPDSPELRQALDQILGSLEVAEDAQRDMTDDDRRWFASELGRNLQPYETDLPRVSATLSGVTSSVLCLAGGDLYITYVTQIVNDLSSSQLSEAELRRATERYLQYLVDRYQYLDFKGMGVSERVPLRLPLPEMYIPLKVRVEVPRPDRKPDHLGLAEPRVPHEEDDDLAHELKEPQPALDVLRDHDGLIILGDPGAGKTVFLKYLALKLAGGEGEELGLGPRLPVLVPLSTYASALAEQDVRLDEFIGDYIRDRVADVPIEKVLSTSLEQGRAVVLLDGLDEVTELGLRRAVMERVTDFYSFHRRAGNKVALTSRIIGYREVRPTCEDLVECTLVDFGDEEIEAFVNRWVAAMERASRGETGVPVGEPERERRELLEAIRVNPGVRGLAAKPLLLTILALMKRQGVRLPERRVQLYDKYVETLLSSWNLARGLGRPPARDLDVVQTVRILAPLALWMHEKSPGVGLVKQEEVRRKLAEIYAQEGEKDPDQAVHQFLQDVHQYAGLLQERDAGQYSFIHLTFEEYLAAVGIGRLGQGRIEPVSDVLSRHAGDAAWREVVLLTIGYLGIVQQWEEAASGVVGELLSRRSGEPGEAAVLMGEAVVDAMPGGVTRACAEKVAEHLARTLRDESVEAALRAAGGMALARLGDPRPDVMTVEGMQFCYVPAGSFWMGTDSDLIAAEDEKPGHEVDVPHGYWIARYPVTVAQFRSFVECAGYDTGNEKAVGGPANHPVVNVTWHEALDFCRWLTVRWHHVLPEGYVASLPSEAEWEKAARGGKERPAYQSPVRIEEALTVPCTVVSIRNQMPKRSYPWGNQPDPGRANYDDTGIGSTSAVGCFPGGASPYGCLDMAGNVWEWCSTLHVGYPYEPGHREDLRGIGPRVLRGGAFYINEWNVRCACRYGLDSGNRTGGAGFRVVVSPGSPP